MLKIADYILSGSLMSGLVLYLLSKLSGHKIDFKSWKTYVVFVILGVVQQLNYHFMNGYIKVLCITIFVIFLYYFYFSKDKKEAVITTIFIQLIIMISEFIFSVIMIAILGTGFSEIINDYAGSGAFLFNFIITIISILIIHIKTVDKIYFNIMNWTESMRDKVIIILMLFIMITINIVYGSTFYKMNTVYLLAINIILLLIYVYIVIKILNEKDRYIRISSKYDLTTSSLIELREVVNILKMNNHENKNQIKTIRNMIKKNDENVIKYIDTLLGDKIQDDEKLMIETSMITNSVISSLVYSKMLTMKEKGINASLHVDKAVEKLNLYDLDDKIVLYICKIIGVWLDNAIEAVTPLEKKNIDIHLFVDLENDFNVTISNSYTGEINLNTINDKGYTTKGKVHGYGLSLVKEIVDKNSKFKVETKLKNHIFTQNLKIKM